MRSRTTRTIVGGFLLWLLASLVQAAILATQEKLFFPFALIGAAIYFGLLALLAIPVWRVCQWLSGNGWPVVIAVHIAMATIVLATWIGLYLAMFQWQFGSLRYLELSRSGLWQALGALITYLAAVLLMVVVQTSRRESDLRLMAREAEIRALKAQLRPHFLFNTLNSIYSLIESRPEDAKRMLDRLAELLRRTLQATDDDFVPLDWELTLVQTYLEIEAIRLGERLRLVLDVDPAARDVDVPPFVLQPLVENAVKHGISRSVSGGTITVSAHRKGERLEVRILDNCGADAAVGIQPSEGRGIELTRRRLEAAYGNGFTLDWGSVAQGGFEVRLALPAA